MSNKAVNKHSNTGNTGKPMNVISAVALGIGSMVGAGIFALMGQAGSIAGSAVYLSFIIAVVVDCSNSNSAK